MRLPTTSHWSAVVLLSVLCACAEDRLRPGPPTLILELPVGATVTSTPSSAG